MASLTGASPREDMPKVDARLKDSIIPVVACDLPEGIKNDFFMATMAVAQQLQKENRQIDGELPVNCLFVSGRSFEISFDPVELSICMRLAVYDVGALLNAKRQTVRLMLMTEELCHLIWGIRDEIAVCYKVLEVLKNILPDLTLSDLGYSLPL